jgi:hypothetical protein
MSDFPISEISDEKIDEFTDNYFLTSNSWGDGLEFIGKELFSIDEGQVTELTMFTFSKMYDTETEKFQKEIKEKYDIDISLTRIGVYIMNRVF